MPYGKSCPWIQTIRDESGSFIDEIHAPEHVQPETGYKENERIVAISNAMRELLLGGSEENVNQVQIQQRCLDISTILQILLQVSLIEGKVSEDLLDNLSKAIAKLIADIYSSC